MKGLFFATWLVSVGVPSAHAWQADLDDSKAKPFESQIRWTKKSLEVRTFKPALNPKDGQPPAAAGPAYYVVLEGVLLAKDASLLSHSRAITQTQAKAAPFSYPLRLTGRVTETVLNLITARGSVNPISLRIVFADYDALVNPPPRKKWSVTPSLAVSYINYTETSVGTLTIVGLTGKLAAQWRLGSRWELGGNGYITILPLWRSDTTRQTRFLGLNARLGYYLLLRDPWAISLMGGYYYTTMLVSPEDHGFAQMNGPQLFPVIYRRLSQGMLVAYFKYSPVSRLSFANREIAGGIGFSRFTQSGHAWSLSLDIANIAFTSTDATGVDRSVDSTSISLGGGYQF